MQSATQDYLRGSEVHVPAYIGRQHLHVDTLLLPKPPGIPQRHQDPLAQASSHTHTTGDWRTDEQIPTRAKTQPMRGALSPRTPSSYPWQPHTL